MFRFFICVCPGWEIATAIAANRLDAFFNNAFPEANALYTNHDQANLVGKTLRIMLLKVREQEKDQTVRETLKSIADHAPAGWRTLIDSEAPADQALIKGATQPELALALIDPDHKPIRPERWQNIINRWLKATQRQPLPVAVSQQVTEKLSHLFASSLREAAKHAWKAGDKAWPAFQIDMAATLVDQVKVGLDLHDTVWKQELQGLSEGLQGLRPLLSRLTLQQRANHKAILAGFKDLSAQLDQIKSNQQQLLTNQEEIVAKLDEYLTPKNANEDPDQKSLPPDLLNKARLLLKRGNLEQQALAAIALKNHAEADVRIQALKKDPLEQAFRVLTLEGTNWYNASQFDKAIQPFEQALALQPNDFQASQDVALAHIQAKLGSSRQHLTKAIAILSETLEQLEPGSEKWATTQNNLGAALSNQGIRTGGEIGAALLAEAVTAYRNALEVITREQLPQQWAATQNNLGNALSNQGSRSGGEAGAALLAEAVTAYRNALEVRTREQLPQQWAATQNNLGFTLSNQGSRSGGEAGAALLAEAVTAYRNALQVRTREQLPQDWAMTQNNLGFTLSNQGSRSGGEAGAALLAEAVTAYRNALQVRTREQLPQQWATTQNNLGNALGAQGSRSGGEAGAALLAEAVTAYRNALEVRTRKQLPQDWATTQNNLGTVLRDQGIRSDGEAGAALLAQAVTAFRNALQVRTRKQLPQDWASTHGNLGNVLSAQATRTDGKARAALLAQAVTAYRNALQVYTREQLPQDWAKTQNNLGIAYVNMENLKQAKAHFKQLYDAYPNNKQYFHSLYFLVHDKLFDFETAFAMNQKWLEKNPDDFHKQVDFAESHLTTARFAEANQRINELLTHPMLTANIEIPLRLEQVTALLAQNETDKIITQHLETLLNSISAQPEDFKLGWHFSGVKHFISQHPNLKGYLWLEDIFVAMEGDRATMINAINTAQLKFD